MMGYGASFLQDLYPFLADKIVQRGALDAGPDLALSPAAGGRIGIRDGLSSYHHRAHTLTSFSLETVLEGRPRPDVMFAEKWPDLISSEE
jgi:hypothetical protein